MSSGGVRPVGSLFFPLDQRLQLGTEGYSPSLLQKIVRQGGKAPSFREAAEDLQELAGVTISQAHVRRLCARLGREWAERQQQEVAAYQQDQLPRGYQAPPKVAAVMLDGGRYQVRAEDQGPGVVDAAWKETKVACCQTLLSAETAKDPQPEPPRKFLEPTAVARLVSTMKARQSAGRSEKPARPRRRRRSKKKPPRPKVLVKTVVATTGNAEAFGWQVAAEVHRRSLDRAERKACVCDGSSTLWALFSLHLVAAGFLAILDFVQTSPDGEEIDEAEGDARRVAAVRALAAPGVVRRSGVFAGCLTDRGPPDRRAARGCGRG